MQITRSRFFLPVIAVALGCAMFAAQWAGGDRGDGIFSLALLSAIGVLVLFGGRSETIRGLRGDGADERFRQIDLRATAVAGSALIAAVIVAFLVEVARGHSGAPYSWLGAVGAVAYLVALIGLRVRG